MTPLALIEYQYRQNTGKFVKRHVVVAATDVTTHIAKLKSDPRVRNPVLRLKGE